VAAVSFSSCPGGFARQDFKPRAVAQLGSALDWGSRGRKFKSCQPDNGSEVKKPRKQRREALTDYYTVRASLVVPVSRKTIRDTERGGYAVRITARACSLIRSAFARGR
jgi:hypothetical protein